MTEQNTATKGTRRSAKSTNGEASGLVADSELPTGHNGRVKVDRYLRVLDHPEIYVAGDLASVTDPRTGHALPPLAQVALEEGETVARNLVAELLGHALDAPQVAVGTHGRGDGLPDLTRAGVIGALQD
jgi:NADH dehydrogenase FAD-containing subunit